MTTVLVVDDSPVDRRLVVGLLSKRFPETVESAANGVEALAWMKQRLPDVIVTDLTMPVMDGLELVRVVRAEHPGIPVVLMTAYGSETLALEALAKGAASYVPKSQLGQRLLDTVDEVLSLAEANRYHAELLDCLTKSEFNFCLQNDPALVDPLVALIQRMVAGVHLVDAAGCLQIGVALKEALLNALFHGSLEITGEQVAAIEEQLLMDDDEVSLVERRRSIPPYRDRRVYCEVCITPDELRAVVRDEGPGFDVSQVPALRAKAAEEMERGRGLSLMLTFMDEVVFNDRGNEVTMVKRRPGVVE